MCPITNISKSQLPYISLSDTDKYIKWLAGLDDSDRETRISLFRDLVLDGTDLGGTQVSYATKEVVLQDNDGAKCPVYAIAIQDIYNKKVPLLNLCFINTSHQQNVDTAHVWVRMEKDMSIHWNYLFCETKPSANRMKVDSVLLDTCEPLTVAQ